MTTQQQIQSDFEKNVFNLDHKASMMIIKRLNKKGLNDFLKNKLIASKDVCIDVNGNYLYHYFFWVKNKIVGLQYLVEKSTELFIAHELSKLFVKCCFKSLIQNRIKHDQPFDDLSNFYTQQIKGYREYLKNTNLNVKN